MDMTRQSAKRIALTALNSILRKPSYWSNAGGPVVLVAVGWWSSFGTLKAKSWTEPITHKEYLERAKRSNCMATTLRRTYPAHRE